METEMECTVSTVQNMTGGAMVQRQILDATYMAVQPTVKNASIIEFNVYSVDTFIELNKTEVEVKFRIKKSDGTHMGAGDKVAVVNYPVATLFNNVEVTVNDKTITPGTTNYAERAVMELLMTYGGDAGANWLQAGLFYKDTAGKMDNADPSVVDAAANQGLKKRAEFTNQSKLVTVRGKLHVDIFNQGKPLINNCRMRLKFTQNRDAYCLMSNAVNPSYKVEIEEMVLWIRKLTVSDAVQKSIIGKSIVMPITKVIQKEFTVTAGGKTFVENNLHSGQLPTKIIMGLVRNDAHVGHFKRNPFNWDHFNVSKVSLFRDGQIVDGRPLSFDFANDQYMDGFWSTTRATNNRYFNEGTLIQLTDYKGGYTLWTYDITPSQCDEQFNDPKQRGALTVEFEFSEHIPHPLTLCVYLQFDSEIIINEAGSVITTFD